jgi:outer membrane receptor protein involved in Fe transport
VFRNVNHFRFNDAFSLEFGADVKSLASDYDNGYQGTTNALGDTVPPVRFDTRLAGTKYGLFADAVFHPASWLTVEAGLRADRFTVNRNGTVSPRVNVSAAIDARTTIKAACGMFHQNLPVLFLAQNESLRRAADPRSLHLVAGVDRMSARTQG